MFCKKESGLRSRNIVMPPYQTSNQFTNLISIANPSTTLYYTRVESTCASRSP